jgi:AAA domain
MKCFAQQGVIPPIFRGARIIARNNDDPMTEPVIMAGPLVQPSAEPLFPNRAHISAHLCALFPPSFVHPYPEAWIEIAYGNAATGGAVNAGQIFSVFDLEKAIDFAEARNKAGFNVYVGPALRQGERPEDGRAKDTHVVTSSHAWAEFDAAGDDKRIKDILNKHGLKPALIIITGTIPHLRAHLYFKLDGTVTPEQLRDVNTALVRLLGSDAVHNNGRIMRLAGTVNYPPPKKQARGYITELVNLHTVPKAPAYQAGKLIKLPSKNSVDNPGVRLRRDDNELLALCEASRQAGQWHTSMRAAIATMIGRGWPDTAIKMTCAPYCEGGADDPDLVPLIKGGRTKWDKPNSDEPESRIHLVPFEDIKLDTERSDLVEGIIPRVGLTVLWGPPKCGKTFWIFDCIMHVALGWKYRGKRIHQGAVVYCAFEGQQGIKKRKAAFEQRHLEEYGEKVPFFLMPVTMDLVRDGPALIAEIKKTLVDAAPVAVVLDTLNRSLRGSESSDEDMSAYIAASDRIREEFSCAIIVVHHCGLNETRPRGHTSLIGALDSQLACTRDTAGNVVVEVELMKDGEEGEVIASKLEKVIVGTNRDGGEITTCVIVPVEDFRPPAKVKPRKLAARDNLSLAALDEVTLAEGKPAPPSMQLPASIRVVPIAAWRSELLARGVIDRESKNPRTDFSRLKIKLTNLSLIGERNDLVWKVPYQGEFR